jgi:hypothetical protein
MSRKINQALWDTWRQRIERRRQCSGTIAAFCHSEGVSEASYHYWQRKLRELTAAPLALDSQKAMAAGESGRSSRRSSAKNGCLQTTLGGNAGFLQLPIITARSNPWIELTLADGTLVRVPQQNTAALASVLRILRGESVDRLDAEIRHA